MTKKLNYTVTENADGIFIAHCLELDLETDGYSADEAVANLREALERFLDDPYHRSAFEPQPDTDN